MDPAPSLALHTKRSSTGGTCSGIPRRSHACFDGRCVLADRWDHDHEHALLGTGSRQLQVQKLRRSPGIVSYKQRKDGGRRGPRPPRARIRSSSSDRSDPASRGPAPLGLGGRQRQLLPSSANQSGRAKMKESTNARPPGMALLRRPPPPMAPSPTSMPTAHVGHTPTGKVG